MKKKTQSRKHVMILTLYVFIALFAPLIANDRPLYISISGKSYFPAFSSNAYLEHNENGRIEKVRMSAVDWNEVHAGIKIFPPVRWSPGQSDLANVYTSPFGKQYSSDSGSELAFAQRHFLGTGRVGNDTLSTLIYGTRNSIMIGFFSTLIAVLIGVLLGGVAGFFGDYSVRISRIQMIAMFLLLIPAWFYSFYIRRGNISNAFDESMLSGSLNLILSLLIFGIIITLPLLIRFKLFNSKKISIPVDSLISRFIEIFVAMPRLILILSIAAIAKPSVALVILLIGIVSWTEIARVTRSVVLKIRHENYVEAARATGMKPLQLFYVHFIPNIKSQVLSIAVFGVAAAILTETGLSFLGVGVPAGVATWGGVMFEARQHYSAWWLVIFSGLSISVLLYSLYNLSIRPLTKS